MTTAKYHVNPKTGKPGLCRAETSCPFGGEEAHHENPEAARQAYESAMADELVPAPATHRGEELVERYQRWQRECGPESTLPSSVIDETAIEVFTWDGSDPSPYKMSMVPVFVELVQHLETEKHVDSAVFHAERSKYSWSDKTHIAYAGLTKELLRQPHLSKEGFSKLVSVVTWSPGNYDDDKEGSRMRVWAKARLAPEIELTRSRLATQLLNDPRTSRKEKRTIYKRFPQLTDKNI